MELVFNDAALDRLEVDSSFSHGLSNSVVASYRGRIQLLRAALDERDLKAMTCLGYRPSPSRSRRYRSVRIDDKHRLIVEVQHLSGKALLKILELQTDER
jgi:proteic killer suppression protein